VLRLWSLASGTQETALLRVRRGAAALRPDTGTLLHSSGRAWRYLRWQGVDALGRTQVGPLEPELTTVL